jgi:hypothetical protein
MVAILREKISVQNARTPALAQMPPSLRRAQSIRRLSALNIVDTRNEAKLLTDFGSVDQLFRIVKLFKSGVLRVLSIVPADVQRIGRPGKKGRPKAESIHPGRHRSCA